MKLFLVLLTIMSCYADLDTWTQFQDTEDYYLVHRPRYGIDYYGAVQHCSKLGASLATIHSKAENDFIYQLARHGSADGRSWYANALISLRKESDGQFSWSDGTELNYSNWMEGEPNTHNTGEECVVIYTPMDDYISDTYGIPSLYRGQWNDLDCDGQFKSIVCQKPAWEKTTRHTTTVKITTVPTTTEREATTTTTTQSTTQSITSTTLPLAIFEEITTTTIRSATEASENEESTTTTVKTISITNSSDLSSTTMETTTEQLQETKANASIEMEKHITTDSLRLSTAATDTITTTSKVSNHEENVTTTVKSTNTDLPQSVTEATTLSINTTTEPTVTKAEHLSPAGEIEQDVIYFNYFYTSVGAAFLAVTVIVILVFVVLHLMKFRFTYVLLRKCNLVADDKMPLVGKYSRRETDDIEGIQDSYSLQNLQNTYEY